MIGKNIKDDNMPPSVLSTVEGLPKGFSGAC